MNQNIEPTRREFIAWGIALATGAVSCGGIEQGKTKTMRPSVKGEALTDLTATEAVTAMRSGDMLAEDYANALLQRCDDAEYLNAFISLQPERVREAAANADKLRSAGTPLGPLHGLPIPVKDSVNTRDYPTTGGTNALRHFQPAENAILVDRLIGSGAIVMGKTNIHELSFGWTSSNQAFGPVRNPYDTDRIPGGSSGGTAAAVASGMAPLGIAEDTQGSIRVPAAMCGICGFRPTTHRYPNTGVIPISPLFDQVGPHARNVADIALFDHVITSEPLVAEPASLDGMRIGMPKAFYFTDLQTDVEKMTTAAVLKLSDAGAEIVAVDVPDLARLIGLTTAQVQLYHVMPMLQQYLQDFAHGITFDELMEQISPDIKEVFERYVLPGGSLITSEEDFALARDVYLPELRKTMHNYFTDNNLRAMIFPTTQITASPIGHDGKIDINGRMVNFQVAAGRNISSASTAGLPGLVVPTGLDSNGLPVSIELDGPAGSDREILAIGLAVEQVLGHLPPPQNLVRRGADTLA